MKRLQVYLKFFSLDEMRVESLAEGLRFVLGKDLVPYFIQVYKWVPAIVITVTEVKLTAKSSNKNCSLQPFNDLKIGMKKPHLKWLKSLQNHNETEKIMSVL